MSIYNWESQGQTLPFVQGASVRVRGWSVLTSGEFGIHESLFLKNWKLSKLKGNVFLWCCSDRLLKVGASDSICVIKAIIFCAGAHAQDQIIWEAAINRDCLTKPCLLICASAAAYILWKCKSLDCRALWPSKASLQQDEHFKTYSIILGHTYLPAEATRRLSPLPH